jgi:hypothetical protein
VSRAKKNLTETESAKRVVGYKKGTAKTNPKP